MLRNSAPQFICACFYRRNIFLKKYRIHVVFKNKKQFDEEYRQLLRMRGCTTDSQFTAVLNEVEKEVMRRKSFHEQSLNNKKCIERDYVRLHPEIWELHPSFLDPRLVILSNSARHTSDEFLLDELKQNGMCVLETLLYQFPVFTKEFCQLLVEEIKNFELFPGNKSQPNTMNAYGVSLDELGLSSGLIEPLIAEWLLPLAKKFFHEWGGDSIDSFKAFTVRYDETGDRELTSHYDNAEVTININLNSEYRGGHLHFGGLCFEDGCESAEVTQVEHKVGHGILHCARQLHSAAPITAGQRYNLVVWMRSSAVRNLMCPMCWQVPLLVEVPFAGEGFTVPSRPYCNYL